MRKITERDIVESVKHVLESSFSIPLYSFFEKRKLVSEGLTMTYAFPRLREIIRRRYNLNNIGCTFEAFDKNKDNDMLIMFRNRSNKADKTTRDNNSWFEVTLFFRNGIRCDYATITDLIHTMDACGWYYAGLIDTRNYSVYNTFNENLFNDYRYRQCTLVFYPKFNEEFKPSSLNDYCYHICPVRVLDKIMEKGITPHANGRVVGHPERVYLFLNKPDKWKRIANTFRQTGKNEKYALLMVYIRDMIEKGIKFYFDENTMTDNPAIYTLEPIPPQNITVVDKEE